MPSRSFYEHSGEIPPLGLAQAVAGSLTAAALFGWFYAEFVIWGQLVYINLLGTMFAGYMIGMCASAMVRLGKLRNEAVADAIGLGAGVFGLYVAWAHDFAARGLYEDAFFTLNPGTVWEYVLAFNAEGGWGVGDGDVPVTGAILWMIWLVEACLFMLMAWVGSKDSLEDAVFCEACNRWTIVERGVREISRDSYNSVADLVADGDGDVLATGHYGTTSGKNCVRVDLAICPDCSDCRFVLLYAVRTTIARDDDGGTEERQSESLLLPPVRISPEGVAAFHGKPGQVARRKRRREKDNALDRSAPITLHCPHCDMKSRIPTRFAGRRGRCPKCKEHVRVPNR